MESEHGSPPPVIVVSHNPEWARGFARLSAVYTRVLWRVPHHVEHVGSTAVRDLAAKPIIDIIIVIPSMEFFTAVEAALGILGYRHNGDQGIPEREVFKLSDPARLDSEIVGDLYTHHLYVCPKCSKTMARMIEFRDLLRQRPQGRARYGELKKALAARYGNDRVGYTDAKTEFIESVTGSPRPGLRWQSVDNQ